MVAAKWFQSGTAQVPMWNREIIEMAPHAGSELELVPKWNCEIIDENVWHTACLWRHRMRHIAAPNHWLASQLASKELLMSQNNELQSILARLASMEAANAAKDAEIASLKALSTGSGHSKSIKVGPSGTLVIRGPGIGRFGLSMYKNVALALMNERRQEILDFITANDSKLSQNRDDKERFAETKLAAMAAFAAKNQVKA